MDLVYLRFFSEFVLLESVFNVIFRCFIKWKKIKIFEDRLKKGKRRSFIQTPDVKRNLSLNQVIYYVVHSGQSGFFFISY